MVEFKNKVMVQGFLSIGLIVVWINYFPFFGPGFYALNLPNLFSPYFFVFTHIVGLLTGSFIYYREPENNIIKLTNLYSPLVISALTIIFFVYFNNVNLIYIIMFFAITGLLSGLLISRWMTWFSAEVSPLQRGAVFGKAVGLTFITLSLLIVLARTFSSGAEINLLFSGMAVLIGGNLINKLPLPPGNCTYPKLRSIIPPADLLLFAAIGYAFISLLYDMIFNHEVHNALLAWLQIIPYFFIALFLARWSDNFGRHIFPIFALLLAGFSFLIHAFQLTGILSGLIIGLLMPSALLCIHFYYWLSLADRQNKLVAPFYLTIGVSFELIIFTAIYAATQIINTSLETANTLIGILGLTLVLVGFAVTTYYLLQNKNRSLNRPYKEANEIFNSQGNLKTSKLYYFYKADQKHLENTLSNHFNLTKREIEVTILLLLGHRNQEINKLLFISMNTLKFHIRNIYSKLGISSRDEAIDIVYSKIKKEIAK